MLNKKKIMLITSIIILIFVVLGLSYSIYTFSKNSNQEQLVTGDIYMHYKESNTLNINNMIPSDNYNENNYFEFTIDGKNTTINKDIIYNIIVSHGEQPSMNTERIQDKFIKFTLFEEKNGQFKKIVDKVSYSDMTNGQIIWKNIIKRNTTSEISHKYRLYAWISGVLVGNSEDASYDEETWNNLYASIKVSVNSMDYDHIMRVSNVKVSTKTNAEGEYTIDNDMETTLKSSLNTLESEVVYEVTITNDDTETKRINDINLVSNSNDNIVYEIINLDNDIVFAKTSKTFKIKIKYKENADISNPNDELDLMYIYTDIVNTIDNPYMIKYIEDLVDLSKSVNKGITYQNKYIRLERNLDFQENGSYQDSTRIDYEDYNEDGTVNNILLELTTGIGWKSIGNETNHFMGKFDGNNKTISNLYVNNSHTKGFLNGFFGYLDGSMISNFSLNGTVTSDAYLNVAGITVNARNSTIDNCHNFVNVTLDYAGGSSAGIIGAMSGTVNIKNSSNSGKIIGGNNNGGLVGYVHTSASLNIDNSYNNADIIQNKGLHAGGLVGRDNSTSSKIEINNSYNIGNVSYTLSSSSRSCTGGFIGKTFGQAIISNSYNKGEVANSSTEGYSGGFIGITGLKTNINLSYNSGYINGGWRIGGMIGVPGSGDAIILKSYNIGSVNSSVTDGISSGLIGVGAKDSKSYIINSYNDGEIISNTDKRSCGLLCGTWYGSGYVINSYNAGFINSSPYSNGILYLEQSRYNIVINNVYNIGALNGSRKYGIAIIDVRLSNDYIETINNAYYLNNTNSGMNNNNYPTTKMTQDEMYNQTFADTLNSNLSGINLASISEDIKDYELSTWKIGSHGYPVFSWQE